MAEGGGEERAAEGEGEGRDGEWEGVGRAEEAARGAWGGEVAMGGGSYPLVSGRQK